MRTQLTRPIVRRLCRRGPIGAAALAASLIAGACAAWSPAEPAPTTTSTTASTTTSTTTVADEPGESPAPRPPAHGARPDAPSWITPGSRAGIGGCALFPDDHVYHTTITDLPVHERSSAMLAATDRDGLTLVGGFSSGIWQGSRSGMPYNVVDGSESERVDFIVTYDYGRAGAHLDVPIPANPRYEGWPGKAWDRHLVAVDTSTCTSHEILNVRAPEDDLFGIGGGNWWADAASVVDLSTNDGHRGTATASKISLLAGLVRFDEVASGRIDHALSVTLWQIKADEYVWPARATDGRSDLPDALPMGSWLRLREDVDLSVLGPQARVVAEALRNHGAIVTDTGPGLKIQGDPDTRWDDDDLDGLEQFTFADFEVIDASGLMVSPESHQVRSR